MEEATQEADKETRRLHCGDYHYSVNWSSEDKVYIGSVAEFPLLRAHASTLPKAFEVIKEVVAFAISDLRLNDEQVPLPEGWLHEADILGA